MRRSQLNIFAEKRPSKSTLTTLKMPKWKKATLICVKGFLGNIFGERNLTYLAKNFGFCAYLESAEATPASSIVVESKKKFQKNIHFTLGNSNLQRNPKSVPKKFSRLCTFLAFPMRSV